jgi:diguanylate cyclase (GGDEF)-like protein
MELKERKRVEEQLSYSALHDALTNLPNRVLFKDRLRHAMERAKRNQEFQFAVFFLDLDRFKVVNDTRGHEIGDLLLIESGKRLEKCVRSVDTIARLGGDEFVVLLEDIKEPSDYLSVADRILHNLSQPSNFGDQKVFVSVSMGIVLSENHYEQPEEILRDADIAMYRAKTHGRAHYEVFDLTMRENVMTRLEMETDLWKAIENQEFIVHYQPILEMTNNHIVGFEALVRWQHPTRGLLMPGEFISIAEEIGLIVPLGYWVLEEACKQIRVWQQQYQSEQPLTINVNLSARQCAQVDLVDMIATILERTKLDPNHLKLELTESLIVEDSRTTAEMLTKLREIGVQIQIDDFGTGYSSLSILHDLPIDTLKIDRTFIQQLEGTNSGMETVRMILSLAHSLGMKVVAEGVETDYQLSSLQSMSCEYAQGFLFAKPVNNMEADLLLSNVYKKKED